MKTKVQVFIKEVEGKRIGDIGLFVPADYSWNHPGLGIDFILVGVPENLSTNQKHLQSIFVLAAPEKWTKEGEEDVFEQPMTIEHWSKSGQQDVFEQPMTPAIWINKNDASVVYQEPEDLENWDFIESSPNETWTHNPSIPDESWTYVAAYEDHWEIIDNPIPRRNDKLDQLRFKRLPLFVEADYKINKLEDNGQDTSAWRAYRQALRDITNDFLESDGIPKASVDSLDVDNFQFPAKPE